MSNPAPQGDLDSLDVNPGVLHRLASIAGRDDFDTGETVELLRADPALTARIFALCRSIEYSRGSPPESIHEAVMRIGAKELYRLTMAVSMARVASQATHLYRDNSNTFWERAVTTAVAMEETCPEGGSREQAFTIGLMHLVGVWILCRRYPAAEGCIESADLVQMAQFERLRFGVAFAQVGAAALARWGFSTAVCEAVCWQNEPELAEDPAHAALAAQLRRAVRLSETVLGTSGPAGGAAGPDPRQGDIVAVVSRRAGRMLRALRA